MSFILQFQLLETQLVHKSINEVQEEIRKYLALALAYQC